MPNITPADALIKAADALTDTILGNFPTNTMTAQAVEQLMEIFKVQAEKATCEARTTRILREQAQAQRVLSEAQRVTSQKQITPPHNHNFEIEEIRTINKNNMRGVPTITQEDDESVEADRPPAENTRLQRQTRTLTQEYLMHMMELPGEHNSPFNAQQASRRQYPLHFLCGFAGAVLDDESGELLEYRHLIKHPKYKTT